MFPLAFRQSFALLVDGFATVVQGHQARVAIRRDEGAEVRRDRQKEEDKVENDESDSRSMPSLLSVEVVDCASKVSVSIARENWMVVVPGRHTAESFNHLVYSKPESSKNKERNQTDRPLRRSTIVRTLARHRSMVAAELNGRPSVLWVARLCDACCL